MMSGPETLDDVKTVDQLGEFVGLKPGEGNKILAEIQANNAFLDRCTGHQFQKIKAKPGGNTALINYRCTCINCGGTMTVEKIRWYERGVIHAEEKLEIEAFAVWVDPAIEIG